MWPSGQVPDQSEFAGAGDRIGAIVHTQFLVGTLGAFFGADRHLEAQGAGVYRIERVGPADSMGRGPSVGA